MLSNVSDLLQTSQMTVIVCISLYQKTVSFQELGASKVLCSRHRQRGSPANDSTLVFWPSSCIRHTPLTARDRRGWKCQLRTVLAHEAGFLTHCTLRPPSSAVGISSAGRFDAEKFCCFPAKQPSSWKAPMQRSPALHLRQNNNLLL